MNLRPLSDFPRPSKIVCVGLNYRQHALEMGKALPAEPCLFLKPTTAIIGDGDTIRLPPDSEEVHYEGELAIVIGKQAHAITRSDVASHIAGYTIMNDVTARDLQRREGTYTRAKGYDTFAPLGPTVACDVDPAQLRIETRLNGELVQSAGCDDLIFDVAYLVTFVSRIMTLVPGDILSTGTPSGVGQLRHDDRVSIHIEGIGTLTNRVD